MQHERVTFPARQATAVEQISRYHLPVPLTSLIGREREREQIRQRHALFPLFFLAGAWVQKG